ncbi:MAG: EAL domain-containing protein [Gammaproteobacteria bacterium]|nr:EAL domain-containing protein [Gammaproteobacteria bacterium]MBU1467203.1 EAL domain-containing protein [Gammaproteobacteria bacterium]MBU2021934.1 EAL domain-containing protein [Gammaproteobacteria bacterium]MBU2239773.1 EAL domain-containing protein [Gammaproteobacteria bacterium]
MASKCFLFFLFIATQLWAENTIISNGSDPRINVLIPTFKETQPISAKDVLSNGEFQQSIYEESQGFSESAYWHKLSFPKTTTPNMGQTIHLALNYYVIEHLDFYLFHGDQLQSQWKRGALESWKGDTKRYNGIWIPISLSNEQDTTLLVRKQGNSPLLTPFMLFDDTNAEAKKEEKLIFWTFIISSLVILLAHNVFVFILLRQPGFVYYLGLNIIIFIALSVVTGFSRWIFSEEISQWIIRNLFVIFGIGAWILFRFSIHFLKEVRIPSPQSLIRKYGDSIFIIFLLSTQLFSVKTAALLFACLEVFLFFICIYWGIKAYLKGFIAVRFYLFSWFFLIIGSILNTLIFWKILPINLFTESILPISSMLQLLGFAFAFADKSKQFERNRKLQALTDSSTNLPNRTYYFDKLPTLLASIAPHSPQLALVMIDISNYQTLNQAFGPAKADSVISEIIQSIHQQALRMEGVLSFPLPNKSINKVIRITATNIILISTTPDQIKQQILKIQRILDTPTLVNKIHFRHQYKIGSALYPTQGADLDKLYQNALIANHSVTYSSGNWAAFTDNLKSNHAHQLGLITQLTDDIEHEKLYFHIQPQVNLADRSIIGGEVLVRWHNEHLGQVSPAEFIPLAEQTGLIYKLTDMLLEKVFQWAFEHPAALSTQRLSINISALDLLQEDFANQVIEKLQNHHLSACKFTIEITETSIFQNNNIVHNNVRQLHHAGFKLAIDDFGVGYSSMQNLVALETDELKIDQFFVMNLLNDPQSQTLCRNMIDLCKALNIVSVAEGIESEEILQLLLQWQCQIGQGYHLYRPMSPNDYLKLLD